MTITQRIVPNIWSNGNAVEMGKFYEESLPNTTFKVESYYPTEGLLDFQEPLAGQPLTVTVMIEGTKLSLINAGAEFRPTPAISFMLNFDPTLTDMHSQTGDEAEAATRVVLERTWEALAAGGTVRMELAEYPFAKLYGWVEDRYGVNWQLMLTNPDGEPRPFVIPALMFGGRAQDKAAEAADMYVELFSSLPGGASIGLRSPYGQATGPASAEALAFGEFRVGEQWFMASDFGAEHAFEFSEGVSLEVSCEGQVEIDRVWDALTAVPEAEECGWLKDKYGVSWQVIPENIAELLTHPDAFEHLLAMKKLQISDF